MEDLIENLKAGDRQAFSRVMAEYKTRIFNYLRLLVGNEELAEELTQDTFVKVYFKAGTLRTDNLKAWIYTIATNLARNEFRKKKLRHIFSLSDMGDVLPAAESGSRENEMILKQLLACLPEKYRVPLVMRELQNFSFREISAITGKPEGTVKTLVFRGKQRMKKILDEQNRESSPEMISTAQVNERKGLLRSFE